MPRRNDTWYECAIIELFRLGYGFTSDVDSPPIGSDDAYYLFYLLDGDELPPLLFEGIVWAAKNRHNASQLSFLATM
jgi:hypothetical protein